MKHNIVIFLLFGVGSWLVACEPSQQPAATPVGVSSVHLPASSMDLNLLTDWVLAYCWQSPERDAFGWGRTDLVVVGGDPWITQNIEYPVTPPATPQSVGCLGTGQQLRVNGRGFSWRPHRNQLATVIGGSNPPGDNLYLVNVSDNFEVELPPGKIWQHRTFFLHPSAPVSSPDGEWLALIGEDSEMPLWRDLWLYQPEKNEAVRVFDTQNRVWFSSALSWSPDGRYVAGIYASQNGGIAIVNVKSQATVSVTSAEHPLIGRWPFALGQSLSENDGRMSFDDREWLQTSLANSSPPAWLQKSNRIVFLAPTQDKRTTLFVMDVDGKGVEELVPGLPGLVGNVSLSPDGQRLAFSRYPSWNEYDRVEIRVLNLENMQIVSLLTLVAPDNGDLLLVSGIDWSPESEYLAFSSNGSGQSDVYIISSNGESWVNLTQGQDGDAVFPLWRR